MAIVGPLGLIYSGYQMQRKLTVLQWEPLNTWLVLGSFMVKDHFCLLIGKCNEMNRFQPCDSTSAQNPQCLLPKYSGDGSLRKYNGLILNRWIPFISEKIRLYHNYSDSILPPKKYDQCQQNRCIAWNLR